MLGGIFYILRIVLALFPFQFVASRSRVVMKLILALYLYCVDLDGLILEDRESVETVTLGLAHMYIGTHKSKKIFKENQVIILSQGIDLGVQFRLSGNVQQINKI